VCVHIFYNLFLRIECNELIQSKLVIVNGYVDVMSGRWKYLSSVSGALNCDRSLLGVF